MLIDFHVHMFPDKIAVRSLAYLAQKAGITTYSDATKSGTLAKMDEWGVDKLVSLNIATTPKQEQNVNDFAISLNNDRIISMGSVNPDSPNGIQEIMRLHQAGIKGIKIHGEYQECAADDKRLYPIYDILSQLGMIVVYHGGTDPGFNTPSLCRPATFVHVKKDFPDLKMVVAHLGGYRMYDEVMTEIAGKDIYLDTSYITKEIDKAAFLRITGAHGFDKVLFASDCPWFSSRLTADFIDSLPLTSPQKDMIYYQNASYLLNL